ncbi:succinyl-CoA synthetase subunit alpha [Candidatus Shapirobacteria bacterium]|nr:succinyl-CoA synthetase subunit alpha [Candidatus Shapirobacteria bacterium]
MKKTKLSNYEYFLKTDTSSYKGKWIAIAEDRVAAIKERADDAFRAAKKKFPKGDISLAKVPQETTLILKIKT